ncbi:YdeI family protein [Flavobacterium qiangtangense]|uniref:YdeI family protein n=1 Tax=Flavobacterium qiangtangense TaxID=1442595 RepID=A0ABW1PLN3_9FLAO
MKEKHTWDKVHNWDEELDFLKSIIVKTELIETQKWGAPVYTLNNKNILAIGGFKNFFTIWFYNGVFLKDDSKVLINANEENTRGLRQWRFTSKKEIDEKLVLKYILEAIENEKKGLAIKPQKKEMPKSDFLEKQFNSDSDLKNAFESFSPYKQKEFLEYIETAKQEKTKVTRFEKIKPMILTGVGLNDKYR